MRPVLLWLIVLLVSALGTACFAQEAPSEDVVDIQLVEEPPPPPPVPPKLEVAIFGGGCFWCMEKPFEQMRGVLDVSSGYAGGEEANPTYEQVSSGATGHVEVVAVRYDANVVTYADLLNTYWRNIDPVAVNRQFCDAGRQYRSVIFFNSEEQRSLAEASRAELQKYFQLPIATEVLPVDAFWRAEDYHQDYYKKNPVRYGYYRGRCGRDERLKAIWGSPSEQARQRAAQREAREAAEAASAAEAEAAGEDSSTPPGDR